MGTKIKEIKKEYKDYRNGSEQLQNKLNSVKEENMNNLNEMNEEQKDLKTKYEALKNEKDEIIKQHQNKTDLTNKEYNELKLRFDEILKGSQNDKTTIIELKNNMDSLRTKNDEYMLQIKTLDAEK